MTNLILAFLMASIPTEEPPPTQPTLVDVEEMIASYGWDYDTALAVAKAESNLDPKAYNPEHHRGCQGSVGIYQIACIHDDKDKLFNAEYNIKKAYTLYKKHGWEIWGAYTNKSYLNFL